MSARQDIWTVCAHMRPRCTKTASFGSSRRRHCGENCSRERNSSSLSSLEPTGKRLRIQASSSWLNWGSSPGSVRTNSRRLFEWTSSRPTRSDAIIKPKSIVGKAARRNALGPAAVNAALPPASSSTTLAMARRGQSCASGFIGPGALPALTQKPRGDHHPADRAESCMMMKAACPRSDSRKVLVNDRAIATAGLAKDVDAVNQ